MQAQASPLVTDRHGLICAFQLAPLAELGNEALSDGALEKPLWLHFNWADGRAREWLKRAHVPPAALETLLEVDPHVHLQTLPEGFVAVLRDLNHEFTDAEVGFGVLTIYVDGQRVISGRRQPLRSVDQLRLQLAAGGLALPSPIALFEHLVEGLAETFGAVVAKLARAVEQAEDEILAGRYREQGAGLRRVRWLLARLRRHASANRAALVRLPAHLPAACGAERRQSLTQAIESLSGVAQDLELVEDRVRLMQEEITARLGESANRTLYLLSIMTTALLPINLITGVFGMNVGGLPWMQEANGFAHVMLIMGIGVLIALVLIARWRAD